MRHNSLQGAVWPKKANGRQNSFVKNPSGTPRCALALSLLCLCLLEFPRTSHIERWTPIARSSIELGSPDSGARFLYQISGSIWYQKLIPEFWHLLSGIRFLMRDLGGQSRVDLWSSNRTSKWRVGLTPRIDLDWKFLNRAFLGSSKIKKPLESCRQLAYKMFPRMLRTKFSTNVRVQIWFSRFQIL